MERRLLWTVVVFSLLPIGQVAAQPQTLSGVLSVVWPDGQPSEPESPAASRPVFTLYLEDGASWGIEPQPGTPPPDFRLGGRRVTVQVASVLAPAARGALPTGRHLGVAYATSVLAAAADEVLPAGEVEWQAAGPLTGPQRWVTIACKFSDVATEPQSLGFFTTMYSSAYPGLDDYWREVSYDQITLTGSSAHGWYTLPRTRSYYVNLGTNLMLSQLAQDCTAAADPDIDFTTVKGINMMFNSDLDGWAWGGSMPLTLDGVYRAWRTTWEPPWAYADISVIAHEMGHGFGFPHSSGSYGQVYDNAWDVMSKDRYNCATGAPADHPLYGCTAQHTIAYHKDLVGWVPSGARLTLAAWAAPTTVTLQPLSGLPTGGFSGLAAGDVLMAVLQTPDAGRWFTVEARKRDGYDGKLYGDGIVIHEVKLSRPEDGYDVRPAHVVDIDNNTVTGDAGALWTVGETFTDTVSATTVTVNAVSGTGFRVTLSTGGTASGPTLSGVSPSSGPLAGGTAITITGTGFVAGATSVSVDGTAATGISVSASTSLTAVTPAHAAGAVAVAVTTSAGTATSNGAFTYRAAPVVTSVSPSYGSTAGGTTISVAGSGFVAGATSVSVGGTPASYVSVTSATTLTAVTAAHSAGAQTVAVTTSGGTGTLASGFTYVVATPAPTLVSVSPASGTILGGTVVTLSGSGFLAGATTVSFGGVAASSVVVYDTATLTAVSPSHSAGTVAVAVTTAGGSASLSTAFTYENPTPTISGISPGSGPANATTSVTITGTSFVAGLTTVTFGTTPATNVSVTSPTSLSAVAPTRSAGAVAVTVANGVASAMTSFTYVAVPTVSGVSPSSGATEGGTPIVITGSGFAPAVASVTFGGVEATGIKVVDDATLSAITPPHAAGVVSIQITTAGGAGSKTDAYSYLTGTGAPTVTGVSPSTGWATGGTTISITGTGFIAGSSSVQLGGTPATSVVVLSPTLITAVTPAHTAGSVIASVTTASGTGAVAGKFTYVALVAPTVTSVTPSAGPPEGGTRLTISGTGFVDGSTAVTVGGTAATDLVVDSATQVSATTPPGSLGSSATVAVTTSAGAGSKTSAFWYGRPPVLTSVEPSRGSATDPWQVALTGTGFLPGVLVVRFGTRAAVSVVVVDAWHAVAVAPADVVGTVAVTVSNLAGSSVLSVEFPGTWRSYLAEGATGPFFDLDIAIANPHTSNVPAVVRFLTADGATFERAYDLRAQSRVTISADTVPGLAGSQVDVSTVVESALPLVVERTMFWSQEGYYAGHGGTAVSGASQTWYFAEGFQGFFDTYLLLANATDTPATVTVAFLRESDVPVVKTVVVAASARHTVFAGDHPELEGRGFAMVVESDVPIIAERAMYFGSFPFWKAGHESAGVTTPATRWSLAEGSTGPYFDTYVLVANPNDSEATLTFTFLLGGAHAGQTYTKTVTIGPNARFTMNPEGLAATDGLALLGDAAVSTLVDASLPVVVERAMYWPGGIGTWTEAHNSFGVTEAATRWGLSEGRVGGIYGFETFVLLANPSPTLAAKVQLTFLREASPPVVLTTMVSASSRANVYANAEVPGLMDGERFGVLIESQPVDGASEGVPIIVERAMYWNSRGEHWAGGTNVTGTPLR